MDENKMSLDDNDLLLAIGVMCVLLVATIFPHLQSLAMGTAVIMTMQTSYLTTVKSGMTRILGVVSGGGVGVAIVLLDNLSQSRFLFILLAGIGIIVNAIITKMLKLSSIAKRVSHITLLLVLLILQGNKRIHYAIARTVGTIVGVVISVVIIILWNKLKGKKEL